MAAPPAPAQTPVLDSPHVAPLAAVGNLENRTT